jgi:hypothetical protein
MERIKESTESYRFTILDIRNKQTPLSKPRIFYESRLPKKTCDKRKLKWDSNNT